MSVSDLLERMPPSVIGLYFPIRHSELPYPRSKVFAYLHRRRLARVCRIVLPCRIACCWLVEQRSFAVGPHELKKALCDQVLVQRHGAGLFVLHGPGFRCDLDDWYIVLFGYIDTA